ncbi:hypothetical protein DFH06DRAFT_1475164 [Mycena polygramma]|nr:hypothetical protein DFH06DRAFT_1475164 [Mycena polygramma]
MSEFPASSSPVPLTLHDLDATTGVLFEGYLLTMVLYGFVAFHVYGYFEQFSRDHVGWKSMIAILLSVDSTALAFLTASVHEYMITQFPLVGVSVNAPTKNYCVDTGCAIVIIFIVQSCYAFRIWTVTKNRVIVALILTATLAAFGLGLVSTARMASEPLFRAFSEQPFKDINAWCQGLTLFAATLTFSVLSISNHRVPHNTNLLDRLHEYCLFRGGAATVLQLGHFVTFVLAPSKHYWIIFHLITRRIFLLSIVSMLNDRTTSDAATNCTKDLPRGSSANTQGTELSDITFSVKPNVSKTYPDTLRTNISGTTKTDLGAFPDAIHAHDDTQLSFATMV